MSSFISSHRIILAVATAVILLAGVGGGLALTLLRPTQLTVLIQDVPRSTQASVLIVGPGGFSRHLANSKTLTVPAGRYRVQASPEPDGSSMVYPTNAITYISVPSNSSRKVVVDYADIVPATTKVGTPAMLNGATVTKSAILAPSSNPGVTNLKAGDILVFGQTPETPKGLLVRVTAVTTTSGMTTLTVTPAPITAALTRAKINLVIHFKPTLATGLVDFSGSSSTSFISDQLGGPVAAAALSKTALVKLSWSPHLPAYALAAGQSTPLCSGSQASGVAVTVNPTASVALSLTATISGSWGFTSGPQFRMVISGNETALAELQADLTGSCSDSATMTLYDLPPVDVQIGPLPIVIVPQVQMHGSFQADLHGFVTLGAKQSITAYGGVVYKNGKIHLIRGLSASASLIGKGGASASLEVSGGPRLLLSIEDQDAGPYMEVLGDVQAKVSATKPSTAGVYAGCGGYVGAEVHFFGINAAAGPWGLSCKSVKLWPKAVSTPSYKPSPTSSSVPSHKQSPTSSISPSPTTQLAQPLVWSSPKMIDSIPNNGEAFTSVSCSSASFCAAVDAQGNALTYNGTTWSTPRAIDPNGTLISVSCASASFCVAMDYLSNVYTWNGATWSSPQAIDPGLNPNNYSPLGSVSCPSGSFCVAVGDGEDAFIWNGATWSSPQAVDPGVVLSGNSLASISCPSVSFCAAVDTRGNALIYNGTTWSSPQSIDPTHNAYFTSISCSSASFCVAVGAHSSRGAFVWNGAVWSSPWAADPNTDGLSSVSCPSMRFCVAVAPDIALTYNGTAWSNPKIIDSASSSIFVSCPSVNFCAAVDQNGNAFTGEAS